MRLLTNRSISALDAFTLYKEPNNYSQLVQYPSQMSNSLNSFYRKYSTVECWSCSKKNGKKTPYMPASVDLITNKFGAITKEHLFISSASSGLKTIQGSFKALTMNGNKGIRQATNTSNLINGQLTTLEQFTFDNIRDPLTKDYDPLPHKQNYFLILSGVVLVLLTFLCLVFAIFLRLILNLKTSMSFQSNTLKASLCCSLSLSCVVNTVVVVMFSTSALVASVCHISGSVFSQKTHLKNLDHTVAQVVNTCIYEKGSGNFLEVFGGLDNISPFRDA